MNQDEFDVYDLRTRLWAVRRFKRISLLEMSKEIGINHITLSHFMDEKKQTAYKVLCMIEDYIKKNEKDMTKNFWTHLGTYE